jgi:hypothetical protein
VQVDDAEQASLTGIEATAGDHWVTINYPSGATERRRVAVVGQQTTKVRAHLK